MVRKSIELDVVDRSGVVQPKPQRASPENAKLLATAKKMRKLGDIETSPLGPLCLSPFQDTAVPPVKVVGETTAETMSLLSASIDNICAENTHNNNNALQTLDHRGIKPGPGVTSSFQYHILVVDDNHVDQRLIEKLLKISSYKVTIVNSAFKALEILGLSKSPPPQLFQDINLIMTNYCMPKMTGYDLLKRVKAKTLALKEIPVIVMSSKNDTNCIKRCLAEGAEEFIIKPVQMSDVKRLWGHIRSQSPSATTRESSGSSICGKRKAKPSDPHEVLRLERQLPWPNNCFVT